MTIEQEERERLLTRLEEDDIHLTEETAKVYVAHLAKRIEQRYAEEPPRA